MPGSLLKRCKDKMNEHCAQRIAGYYGLSIHFTRIPDPCIVFLMVISGFLATVATQSLSTSIYRLTEENPCTLNKMADFDLLDRVCYIEKVEDKKKHEAFGASPTSLIQKKL